MSETGNKTKDIISTGLTVLGALEIASGIQEKDATKIVSGVVNLGVATVANLAKDKE
jgi:hypothetical protein